MILCCFLLKPFDFQVPFLSAAIKRFPNKNGVQITSGAGIKSTLPASKIYKAMMSGDGITIEAWVATKNITQKGLARIVSYSSTTKRRNFTLGQSGKDLILRLRTTQTNLNGMKPQARIKNVFKDGDIKQHIVGTYDFSKEKIYINGKKRLEIPGSGGMFSNWNNSYFLILGNELRGSRPWLGELYLVAVYNRALSEEEILKNYNAGRLFVKTSTNSFRNRIKDGLVVLYPFNEEGGNKVLDQSGSAHPLNLHMAISHQLTNNLFLSFNKKHILLNFRTLRDIIGNVLIFLPFGYLLHANARRKCNSSLKSLVFVLVSGTIFSLGIESLQYLSVARYSSIIDLFNNALGTALGAAIDNTIYKKALKNIVIP